MNRTDRMILSILYSLLWWCFGLPLVMGYCFLHYNSPVIRVIGPIWFPLFIAVYALGLFLIWRNSKEHYSSKGGTWKMPDWVEEETKETSEKEA